MLIIIRCLCLLLAIFSCTTACNAGHKSKKHKGKKQKVEAKATPEFLPVQAAELAYFLNEVPPPAWMLEQIREDLAQFDESGISTQAMDQLMAHDIAAGSPKLLLRYRIENNCVDVNFINIPPRYEHVTNAIKKIAEAVPLPDLDFIVSMHDAIDEPVQVPIFSFAKNPKRAHGVILIPDFESLGGRGQTIQAVQEKNSKNPWSHKKDLAVWRGSRTGGDFTIENFFQFPRTAAVTCSLMHPELVDARFATHAQEGGQLQLTYPEYFGNALSIDDQIKYKYQLLIDGNSCAYSGAYWRLFSNSVILKQSSDAIQWYYRAMHPNVHYIPVNSDLSNLPEVIEWAKNHDAEARQISHNAQAFANENLTDLRILQYVYYLLLEYSKIPYKNLSQ